MTHLDLDTLMLFSGAHDADSGQMCVMEAVAFVAGEPWSDAPQCASPVVAAFCRVWNDTDEPYGAEIRARLKTYIPRLVNSRGTDAQEQERAWMALDWLMHVHEVTWLRLAGLEAHAQIILDLPPQTSEAALAESAAARDAAWAAARDAARERLEPTVRELQVSAWQLLDAMLAVTEGGQA